MSKSTKDEDQERLQILINSYDLWMFSNSNYPIKNKKNDYDKRTDFDQLN